MWSRVARSGRWILLSFLVACSASAPADDFHISLTPDKGKPRLSTIRDLTPNARNDAGLQGNFSSPKTVAGGELQRNPTAPT